MSQHIFSDILCVCVVGYCVLPFRKLEEKHVQVMDILNNHTSWQSLPVKAALEGFIDIQSQLSNIKTLCDAKVLSQMSEPCPKVSFEMCALSEILPFASLGRIVLGKEKERNPVRTGHFNDIASQEMFGEQLPIKKKRKNCA